MSPHRASLSTAPVPVEASCGALLLFAGCVLLDESEPLEEFDAIGGAWISSPLKQSLHG